MHVFQFEESTWLLSLSNNCRYKSLKTVTNKAQKAAVYTSLELKGCEESLTIEMCFKYSNRRRSDSTGLYLFKAPGTRTSVISQGPRRMQFAERLFDSEHNDYSCFPLVTCSFFDRIDDRFTVGISQSRHAAYKQNV